MDNTNDFKLSTDYASTGNDNFAIITLNVPAHSVPPGQDSIRIATSPAPSSYSGKQMRAQIESTLPGSVNTPATSCGAVVDITYSGGSGQSYAMFDVYRLGGNAVLRCRTINQSFPPTTINFPAFTVTARVRTIIGT